MSPIGVHLVGSVPFGSAEDVFLKASKHLSTRLRSIPDGETGFRRNWTVWQATRLKHLGPDVFHDPFAHIQENNVKPAKDDYYNPMHGKNSEGMYGDEEHIEEFVKGLPEIHTQYDVYALESYEIFKKLKEEGKIPPGTRFQVSIPTPVAVVAQFIVPALMKAYEPVYTTAIVHAVEKIQENIPASELALQWDVAIEVAILEGVPLVRSWWAKDQKAVLDGICERLARLVELAQPGVRVGLHLCYGDAGHKHFKQPADLGLVTDIFEGTIARTRRNVDFLHVPVPKGRQDNAYFEPLIRTVRRFSGGGQQSTELFLGVVHAWDEDGAKRRIKVAGEVLGCEFGIATECGMGRIPDEDLESIFFIMRNCAEPYSDGE